MGQEPEKALPYVKLEHHFSNKEGVQVLRSKLLDCLQVAYDYNS